MNNSKRAQYIYDKIKYSHFLYYSVHIFYIIAYFCLTTYKNCWIFNFLVFGFIPIIDKLFELD